MSQYSDGSLDLKQRNTSWTKVFEYIPDESVVLDIGCSSGTLGKELKRLKKCTVYGIEINQRDYEAAKKVLAGAFRVNVEDKELPPELTKLRFDAIIMADVIEHLVDPAGTLRRLQKLLKPNGRVVYSIPNMSHLSVRLNLLKGSFNYAETGLLDKMHLHFYDYDEVQRVMARAGLQIEHNDANSLPYTQQYIQGFLKKLGLEDKGFIKRIQNDMQARTFQFVGFALPAKDPSKVRPMPLHTSTPEQDFVEHVHQMDKEHDHLKRANSQLAKRVGELQRQNISLITENQALKGRLDRYTNSLVWKAAKYVTKPRRKK